MRQVPLIATDAPMETPPACSAGSLMAKVLSPVSAVTSSMVAMPWTMPVNISLTSLGVLFGCRSGRCAKDSERAGRCQGGAMGIQVSGAVVDTH